MSSDTPTSKVGLSDICTDISYGYTASATSEKLGPKFLRITDIQGGNVRWETVPYCEIEVAQEPKYSLTDGDIVVARTGNSTGENYIFSGNEKTVFASYLIRFRVNAEIAYPHFVWYQMRSSSWWDFVNSSKTGSAQAGANAKVLGSFLLSLPPMQVQVKIASLLRLLDDRIVLLRETSTTLESIAQALFKSWFVDFDPVRAKQEGREPEGMDADTAALFPDAFEESELGLVPKGWRIGMLEDLARMHKGSINPLNQLHTVFEHYSLPAFDNGQMPVMEAGTEIKSNKTIMPVDSVLLSKLNPHIPRVWLPSEISKNAICSTEFLVFVPKDAPKEFLYSYFTTSGFQRLLCQLVTGTSNSHQRVKPDAVLTMRVVIPLAEVLNEFGVHTRPLFDRIKHNRQKAKTIATIRDTLLPRLISGQLRLPEAEELVEEAAA